MRVRAATLVAGVLLLTGTACDDDPGVPDAGAIDASPPDAAAGDAAGDAPGVLDGGTEPGASAGLAPAWRDDRCTVWTDLPPPATRTVAATGDDVVFLGDLGVARVRAGVWSLLPLPAEFPADPGIGAWQVRGDQQALLWNNRVFLGDRTWTEVRLPDPTLAIDALALGPGGDLYLGTAAGPILRRRGQDWTTSPATPREQSSLWATADRLYQGSAAGIRVLEGPLDVGQWQELTLPVAALPCRVWGLDGGAVYAACGKSLLQLEGTTARLVAAPTCPGEPQPLWGTWDDGLVMAVRCTEEATSVWRHQAGQWTPLPAIPARPGGSADRTILAGAGDRLYAVTDVGLRVLRDGQWSDTPEVAVPIGSGGNLRQGAVAAAADGTLYGGGPAGLLRQDANGDWRLMPGTAGLNVIEVWPSPGGTVFLAARLPDQGAMIGRYRDGTVHRDLEVPPLQLGRLGLQTADAQVSRFAGAPGDRVFVAVSGFLYTWTGSAWSKGPALPCQLGDFDVAPLVSVGPEIVLGQCSDTDALYELSGTPPLIAALGLTGTPVALTGTAAPSAVVVARDPTATVRLRTAAGWTPLDIPVPEVPWHSGAGADMNRFALFSATDLVRVVNGTATVIPYPRLLRPVARGFWSDGRRVAFAGGGSLGVCDLGPW